MTHNRFASLKKLVEITTIMPVGRRAKIHIGKWKAGGKGVAIIVRRCDQIYRGKFATMTEARENGVLSWMLDGSLVPILQETHNVEHILTLERENGDLWVSKIADWADDTKLYKPENPLDVRTDRMGFALRHLPVHHMIHMPGELPILPRAK
jgi:hypothetical protein